MKVEIIKRHLTRPDFTAADIRVFLARELPYYESEDKDDFIYLVRAEDLERVSTSLFHHLIGSRSADSSCSKS